MTNLTQLGLATIGVDTPVSAQDFDETYNFDITLTLAKINTVCAVCDASACVRSALWRRSGLVAGGKSLQERL